MTPLRSERRNAQGSPAHREPRSLARREREVLALLSAWQTGREIGEQLSSSRHTGSTHVAEIPGKLAVRARREAAALANVWGLVL